MKIFFWLITFAIFFASCKPSITEKKNEITTNSNCSYSRDELDPVGKPIRVLEDALFISLVNNDTALGSKSFNNAFMKGYLSCVRVDTVMGIYFDFKIYSPDAYRDYGMIRKGDKITFILASGKTVAIPFSVTFSGNTNLSSEYTEYRSFSNISRKEAEILKSSELDRVTILWTKREEEYKAVNPAIFINQIPCVE